MRKMVLGEIYMDSNNPTQEKYLRLGKAPAKTGKISIYFVFDQSKWHTK